MVSNKPMYSEDDLLPISALQHLAFCERQWGLIHLEAAWQENVLTVQGRQLHDKAHDAETEVRGGVRVARGLRLRSLRLGLIGMADVVEFHRLSEEAPQKEASHMPQASAWGTENDNNPLAASRGVALPGAEGLWQPLIVEYKRGKPKVDRCDEVQVCAQALCLEEMLNISITSAAFFYGQPRRRYDVTLDETLRSETEALSERLHELTRAGSTPPAEYSPKCQSCSLINICLPKSTGHRGSVRRYLERAIGDLTPNPFPKREGG